MVSIIKKTLHVTILVTLLLTLFAFPSAVKAEGPYWQDNDNKPMAEPDFKEPSLAWMSFKRTVPDQLLELLDLDRNVRKIIGKQVEALNLNSYDEVPNSSWFTNRHGYPATRLTPEEITTGISITSGPDLNGKWKVFRPKLGGATPGFWIEDAKGDQYLIKFDPHGYNELSTAAAAMGSHYFYACGYNVPQEIIVYWRPEMLEIKEGAMIKSSDGSKRPLSMQDIEAVLEEVNHTPDGRIRSIASLNIGNVKGPFLYNGIDKNDPNDWCPHQHRRELRGLRVIGSLVNHYDLKDHNSMNVYVGPSGEGYLKHYLMDFGSTFGSDGNGAKIPKKGYANLFDLRDVLVTTGTFGIKTWAWEYAKPYQYPSIGYFESDLFEPHKFDPIVPNPAFEQLTSRDGYWGAKVVSSFSDADLAALVEVGQYSNSEAAEYILQTLIKRRDKITRHWFKNVNPLDYPYLVKSAQELELVFEDLWLTAGLGKTANHEFVIKYQNKEILAKQTTAGNSIKLNSEDIQLLKQYSVDCNSKDDCNYYDIMIYSERDGVYWKMPVIFTLNLDENLAESHIASIKHPD